MDWEKLRRKYEYSPDQIKELQLLYSLRGKNQNDINKQRQILRNMGFISLPFSMNRKKEN